jgi:S1-C subfamily serine protease
MQPSRGFPAVGGLALLASLALGGCREAPEATPEQKLASFAPVAALTIGRQPVATFARNRTGLLIGGAAVVGASVVDGAWAIDFAAGVPADASVDLATALAISPDGYLLTCAHAVLREPLFLCTSDGQTAQTLPVRVVWRGDPSATATDLAIIQVDTYFSSVCRWADPGSVLPGVPVIGWGRGGAAGHLVSGYSEKRRHGLGSWVACHDMPTCGGDSGGPVMTTDGAVIGITSRIKGTVGPHTGTTEVVRPDLDWLFRAIDRDRMVVAHCNPRPTPDLWTVVRSGDAKNDR